MSLDVASLLARLDAWAEAGALRRLDAAFARFVAGHLGPGEGPAVVLAAALVAHREGEGHASVPLDELRAPRRLEAFEGAGGLAASLASTGAEAGLDDPGLAADLAASRVVRDEAGGAADQGQPLVLHGQGGEAALSLRRHRGDERRVALGLLARAQTLDAPDAAACRAWIGRLFPPERPGTTDWQRVACATAVRARVSVITGGPGTGKTWTAARVLALQLALHPQPGTLRIGLAAPTGKAAARLRQSIDAALAAFGGLELPDGSPLSGHAARIGPARTLHAWLGARPGTRRFAHDAQRPLPLDVLLVDEASMVHLEMMAALLDALPPSARLVLLGDRDQLASVEAGAVLAELCGEGEPAVDAGTAAFLREAAGVELPAAAARAAHALARQTVVLRESRRFGGPIGALARAVNAGDARGAERLLEGGGSQEAGDDAPVRPGATARATKPGPQRLQAELPFDEPTPDREPPPPSEPAPAGGPAAAPGVLADQPGLSPAGIVELVLAAGYREHARSAAAPEGREDHAAWVRARLDRFDALRLLTALRDGRFGASGLNAAIESALAAEGLPVVPGGDYAGRPVLVTRNEPAAGLFNGDVGLVLPDDRGRLKAWFADGAERLRAVSTTRLPAHETAWATTVHKAQGSEFAHVVLVLPDEPSRVLTRELVYTGLTRARERVTLVRPRPAALAEALARRTQRGSALGALLRDPALGALLRDPAPGALLRDTATP